MVCTHVYVYRLCHVLDFFLINAVWFYLLFCIICVTYITCTDKCRKGYMLIDNHYGLNLKHYIVLKIIYIYVYEYAA